MLSPHLDDAALSVGGLLLQHGDAVVVTAFTADPPQTRPKSLAGLASPDSRRREDARAMDLLGARFQHLNLVDAVDRRSDSGDRLYPTLASIFGVVHPECAPLCAEITQTFGEIAEDRLILCPMAVGAHVDHQLCSHVGRRLVKAGREVLFYEDAPYVYPEPGARVASDSVLLASARMRARVGGLEDVGIDPSAKTRLVACYESQIVDLFGDLAGYENAARSHFEFLGGEIERLHHLRM